MDENAWVRAARRGDRTAFNELVARYSRAVVARALAWTGDLAMAEDLAQETFLRAWIGLARLENDRAFGSWLLSIGGFVGQEWRRRRTLEQKMHAHLAAVPLSARADVPDVDLARVLAELPLEVQQLLAFRHHLGLSCEEISRETGKPLGTVTKTLSRAYERLRSRLART
jgi:RNA polymerase sigma-70 factor (ECF subfamily)